MTLKLRYKAIAVLCCLALTLQVIPLRVFAAIESSPTPIQTQTENTSISENAVTDELEIVGEDISRRTETSKHFRTNTGGYIAALYGTPVHYEKDGAWVDYDNRVTLQNPDADENVQEYANAASDLQIRVSKKAKSNKMFTVQKANSELSWGYLDIQNSTVEIQDVPQNKISAKDRTFWPSNLNQTVWYPNIYANVDLRADLHQDGVKETLVLQNTKARNTFEIEYKTDGLTPVQVDARTIELRNGEEVVYTLSAPYMMDANGERSTALTLTLSEIKNKKFTVELTADNAWLSDPARAYPVEIDPGLALKRNVRDFYDTTASASTLTTAEINKLGVSEVFCLYVGNYLFNSKELVALLKIDIDEIPEGAQIIQANLNMRYLDNDYHTAGTQMNVYRITSSWNTNNVVIHGSAFPSYDATPIDYHYESSQPSNGSGFYFDVTSAFRYWEQNGYSTNYGVMLKLSSFSTSKYVSYASSDYGSSGSLGNIKPLFTVQYFDGHGVESYWTTTSAAAGRTGAAYVNHFNGRLTATVPLAGIDGNRMPVGIQWVYNQQSATWKTNYERLAMRTTSITDYPYCLTDADGTDHYFYTKDGKLVDESGMGYTLTVNSSGTVKYEIVDKSSGKMQFNSSGKLLYIYDSNNNRIKINYGSNGKISSVLDGADRTYTYTWSNNLLTGITDPANRTTSITYTSSMPTKVIDPDGESTSIIYDSANHPTKFTNNVDGSYLQITYRSSGVKKVQRFDQYVLNGSTATLHSGCGFTYNDTSTTVTDNTGRSETYTFNEFGQTVSYIDNSTGMGEFYEFGKPTTGSGSGNNNKLLSASRVQNSVVNLLKSPMFGNGVSDYYVYPSSMIPSTPVTANVEGYNGLKGVRIQAPVASENTYYYTRTEKLLAGTYTASVYVRTNAAVPSPGITLVANVFRSDGSGKYRMLYGETVTGETDGWKRLYVTFDVDGDYDPVNIDLLVKPGATADVTLSGYQLEKGTAASAINLVENANFDHGTHRWTAGASPTIVSISGHSQIKKAIQATGNSQSTLEYKQTIPVSGKKGDVFSFGGWGCGNSVFLANGSRGRGTPTAHVRLEFSSGGSKSINFNSSVWQFVSGQAIAPANYTSVTLVFSYNYNLNSFRFANPFVYKEGYGQSYTYDDNGNVVSSVDLANTKASFVYKDENLSKLLNPTGTGFEYIYDSNKNLTEAFSSEGIRHKITYDNYGNPTSTVTEGTVSNAAIQAGKKYYIRLKGSGKYLTAYLGGTTDETNVVQGEALQNSYQLWELQSAEGGYYTLIPDHAPGMALDVFGALNTENTNVNIYTQNGTTSQKFKITPQADYTYTISPACSPDGKLVTVNSSATQNNVAILSPQGDLNADQSWYFEDADRPLATNITHSGIYQFVASRTGRYITVSNAGTAVSTPVVQAPQVFGEHQKFLAKYDWSSGGYTLSPLHAPDRLLQISSEPNGYDGYDLELGDSTINDRKLFYFAYNADWNDFYIVPCFDETMGLDIISTQLVNGDRLHFSYFDYGLNDPHFFVEPISDTISSSATYTENGNYIKSITDMLGNVTSYNYNATNGTLTSVTDPKNNTTSYTYNANNNRLESVTAAGKTVNYTYDKDRLSKITLDGGNLFYNFIYDAFGRQSMISLGNSAGAKTLATYGYNNRHLLEYLYYGGNTSNYLKYTYDSLDRTTAKEFSNGQKATYGYNGQNLLAVVTDTAANTRTRYSYDLAGRMTESVTLNGTSDDSARKASAGWTYEDSTNRLQSYTTTMPSGTNGTLQTMEFMLNYGDVSGDYDSDGNSLYHQKNQLRSLSYNGTEHIQYEYDDLGRVVTQKYPAINSSEMEFMAIYSYEGDYRTQQTSPIISSVEFIGEHSAGWWSTYLQYYYHYDANQNIVALETPWGIEEEYSYDNLNQLTRIIDWVDSTDTRFTYDNRGNILNKTVYLIELDENTYDYVFTDTVLDSKTYQYSDSIWKDLLTSYDGQTITYDGIGNPLQYRNSMNMTWQNGRQLSTITKGTDSISYAYDIDGNRTSKTVNGITTTYYMSGGVRIGERRSDGVELRYLLDQNGSVYGLIYYDTVNDTNSEGQLYYLIRDGQGNVSVIMDANGNPMGTYLYDTWGKSQNVYVEQVDANGHTKDSARHIMHVNPFRYRGYYYDAETGFYYCTSRYYDPEIARWINADGEMAGVSDSVNGYNLFVYCFNNPVSMEDPSGNWPSWGKVFKAIAGVAIVVAAVAAAVTAAPVLMAAVAVGYTSAMVVAGGTLACSAVAGLCGLSLVGEAITDKNPVKDVLGQEMFDVVTTVSTAGMAMGVSAMSTNSSPASPASPKKSSPISSGDARRIQNAANKTGQNITVIGSRANGTAGPNSDWDYIMSGNSSQRHSAASSVPHGIWGGANNTGIDIFSSYPNGPNPIVLDRSKPYIEFFPE